MKITSCKVNHLVNPMGVQLGYPVFQWIVEDADGEDPFHLQYRITITTTKGDAYETEWKNFSPLGTELPLPLAPRTRYEWSLSVRMDDGSVIAFPCGFFETGKAEEPWSAQWITCDNEQRRHPVFMKEFSLQSDKLIHSARLYITGLGLYEAYINGEKAGDEFLAPGCTAYSQWLQVQTYDVTGHLKDNNSLSVLLGNGWYKGRFGANKDFVDGHKRRWEMIAELHINYKDGTSEMIASDSTWKVVRSNMIASDIYDGEIIDDTLEKLPEEQAAVCDGPGMRLLDRLSPPVKEQEHFTPTVIQTPAGELVLDLGQNHSGLFRLKVHEPKGTKLRIQVGETLQDGNFYRDNLRSAKAEFRYTSDGEERILRPHFTFYGYRYAKLEGFTNFTEEDFESFAIYSDMEERGSLVTGHSKVNKLISNTKWGMKSNFVDVPTDCPQRDERMGWTGDAQVFSSTALYLADAYAFYTKYLFDMGLEQKERNGMVPDIVPAFHNNKFSAAWGDATCIIPWNMYLFTGDAAILHQHYENMKAWVTYIERIDNNNHGWRKVFHYGDWLALDCPYTGNDQVRGGTDEGFVADVYYRKSLLIVAKTASVLGYFDEAKRYETKADQVLKGLQEEFYSVTGRCCIPTQTAAVLTLHEKLHRKDRAIEQLSLLLENREDKLSTGFVGTPILCETLTECGLTEKAYKLLLNDEYPGWLYAIDQGATTIWERWNSIDETGHISSTGMNSLNHYAYGSIVSWIWNGCAGLSPVEDEPGFRKARIAPQVNYKLSKMDAVYHSPAGTYQVFWEIEGIETIRIKIHIPAGCEAHVELPYFDFQKLAPAQRNNPLIQELIKGETVPSGDYEICYRSEQPLIMIFTVDDILQNMLTNQDAKRVLYRELADVEKYIPFGRDYPLRETMDNYGDGSEELYCHLNEELRKAAYMR